MLNYDYILRSDALKAVHYENWREGDYPHTIDTLHLTEYQLLAEAINNIPAVDVEPVRRGRWERKPDPYGFFETIPVCSVCGCTTKWREEYLYCPHCGAKMDKEVKNESN